VPTQRWHRWARYQPRLETLAGRLAPGDALLGVLTAGALLGPTLPPAAEAPGLSALGWADLDLSPELAARPPAPQAAGELAGAAGAALPDQTVETGPAGIADLGSLPAGVSIRPLLGLTPAPAGASTLAFAVVVPDGRGGASVVGRNAIPGEPGPATLGRADLAALPRPAPTGSAPAEAGRRAGRLPFYFERNVGQADAAADFLARGPGYGLALSATEAVVSLPPPGSPAGQGGMRSRPGGGAGGGLDPGGRDHMGPGPAAAAEGGAVVARRAVAATPAAAAAGMDPLVTKVNYFLGKDPTQWHTNIPTYGRVAYHDVYPGIDLVYYGSDRQLEYDFIVAPGADPS